MRPKISGSSTVSLGVGVLLLISITGCGPPEASETSVVDPQQVESGAVAETAEVPATLPATTLSEHRIAIRSGATGAEFYDKLTDERFVPRGVNYVWLPDGAGSTRLGVFEVGFYDRDRFRADMDALRAAGYNTARIFLEHCVSETNCMGNPSGEGLNPDYLDNLVDAMTIAGEEGIFLLLTSNDLPGRGGYWERSNRGESDQFAGYRNAHYLTSEGVEAAVLYWSDLMQALVARGAPMEAVLGWQLLNEQWMFKLQPPLSLASGTITTGNGASYDLADPAQRRNMVSEGLLHYIEQTRAAILEHNPTALITMGFFSPKFPNETGIGGDWYVDTAALIEGGALLDFYDFHAYPGEDILLGQIAENFGMLGYDDKPILLGEYGAFQHRFDTIESGARAVGEYVAESCDYGFDGWLYWDYYAAPLSVGDATYGLVANDGFLMNLFSPVQQPDPCVPVEVESANLAFGASTRSSRFLPGEPPELAVDENLESQWGAGAEPTQWIEIDFGGPVLLSEVRLLVAQFPAGSTSHRIHSVGPGGSLILLHEFNQETMDGDWLVFTPDSPILDVQIIRITTLASPSWVAWKEVQAFGERQE